MALVSLVVIALTSLRILIILTTATSKHNSEKFYSHIFINIRRIKLTWR